MMMEAMSERVGLRLAKGRRRVLGSATVMLLAVMLMAWGLSTYEVFGWSEASAGGKDKRMWAETEGKRIAGADEEPVVTEGMAVEEEVELVPEEELPETIPGEEAPNEDAQHVLGEGSGPISFGDVNEFAHLSNQIPDCVKNRKKPPGSFLLFMTSHAGSTAVFSELTMHPDIFWDRTPQGRLNTYEPLRKMEFRHNQTAGIEWVRSYFTKVKATGQIPAFKLSIYPVLKETEEWIKLVEEFDTQIIFNYRRDHLRRAIGRYAFRYLGDHTSIGGINVQNSSALETLEDRCSVGVGCNWKVEEMSDLHCIMTRSWRSFQYKALGVDLLAKGCALEVAYEDYLEYPDDVINQILDYLRLPRAQLSTLREKGTSNNLCELISNFDELCAAYGECSRWGWALEDKENNCSCNDYDYVSRGDDKVNPLCSQVPQAGADFWCFGVCQYCPQSPGLRDIFPSWPSTDPFNDIILPKELVRND